MEDWLNPSLRTLKKLHWFVRVFVYLSNFFRVTRPCPQLLAACTDAARGNDTQLGAQAVYVLYCSTAPFPSLEALGSTHTSRTTFAHHTLSGRDRRAFLVGSPSSLDFDSLLALALFAARR